MRAGPGEAGGGGEKPRRRRRRERNEEDRGGGGGGGGEKWRGLVGMGAEEKGATSDVGAHPSGLEISRTARDLVAGDARRRGAHPQREALSRFICSTRSHTTRSPFLRFFPATSRPTNRSSGPPPHYKSCPENHPWPHVFSLCLVHF